MDWTKEAYSKQEQLLKAESALAQQAEDLLAYKDYYGTSVAQVKHLQECAECSFTSYTPYPTPCSDYPTE